MSLATVLPGYTTNYLRLSGMPLYLLLSPIKLYRRVTTKQTHTHIHTHTHTLVAAKNREMYSYYGNSDVHSASCVV